jgi:YfiH family protein
MEWITTSGLRIGTFPALGILAPELEVYVTTRAGGVSPSPFDSLNLGGSLGDRKANIAENRRRLCRALGISSRRLARTGQIHGAAIVPVHQGGIYRGFDGFVTETPDLTLAISTADCYSVVVYSPPERALAAIHVGRRGAERGIIAAAVEKLRVRYRIDPAYAIAVVGPGICGKCYTVSRTDARLFPRTVRRYDRGRWHLDLAAFCERELIRQGIRREHILSAGLCTACNPERFFSHRRDAGITGRHWTLATIRCR